MERDTQRNRHLTKKQIAVLVYENCSFVDIGLILEAFRARSGPALFGFVVVARRWVRAMLQ
jgi:hypothetical protein